ncbi:hypothetical protein PtA15_12A402 [Puccinia triticina]|uniref:RxLR effector protein n=1 Tax=Puccinia triticina TaxID=208348 RepID=A0ABY7CYN0_9BASI|nr:uncharacterized protein PtA15_12A402 [Puccinia triticina]WAQ90413.1 hypothetical protein PtA15_12A402 [Puccinia triticina]
MNIHRFNRFAIFGFILLASHILSLPMQSLVGASAHISGGLEGGKAAHSMLEVASNAHMTPAKDVELVTTHGSSDNILAELRNPDSAKTLEHPHPPLTKPTDPPETKPPIPETNTAETNTVENKLADPPKTKPTDAKTPKGSETSRLTQLRKISGDGFAYFRSLARKGAKASWKWLINRRASMAVKHLYENDRASLSLETQKKIADAIANRIWNRFGRWALEKLSIKSSKVSPGTSEAAGHSEEASMAAKSSGALEDKNALATGTTTSKGEGGIVKPAELAGVKKKTFLDYMRAPSKAYNKIRNDQARRIVYGRMPEKLAKHVLEELEKEKSIGSGSKVKKFFKSQLKHSSKIKPIDDKINPESAQVVSVTT